MVFPPLPRICALEGFGLWGFIMLKAVDVCRPSNRYVIGCPGHVNFRPHQNSREELKMSLHPRPVHSNNMVLFTIGTTGL